MPKTQAEKNQAKRKILYISYDGILEPLGHSQVLKYISFLSKDFSVTLISFEKIYQSTEVVEKEIAGYQILNTLLDTYCQATQNYIAENQTSYDELILKAEGENFDYKNKDLYLRLISICQYVASLTDGNALQKFKKIKGLGI